MRVSFLLFIIFLMFGCQSQNQLDENFIPPKGEILTFLHEMDYPYYSKKMLPESYGVAIYANLFSQVAFKAKDNKYIRELSVLLDTLKNRPLMIKLRLTNKHLKEITEGKAEKNLDALAKTLMSHNKQIYLAVGFEINNPRYFVDIPSYVKAHQILVKRFRKLRVKNVSYVWHIIGMKPLVEKLVPFEDCYPGDEYVNWLGLSMHNITPQHFDSSGFFGEALYDEVVAFANDHELPIMICESSTKSVKTNYGYSGDVLWYDWYVPFISFIENNDVRAMTHLFVYFDDKPLLKRWKEELMTPKYVHDGYKRYEATRK